MTEENEDSNIQWKKKKKLDKKEIVGINTNAFEAALEEKKNKTKLTPPPTSLGSNKKQLPKDMRKIRKKIRQVFDEDDEDEDEYIAGGIPQELELLDLQKKAKTAIENSSKQNLTNHKIAQNVIQADQANKMFLQMGLKNISKKAINSAISDNTIGQSSAKQIISKELKDKTGLKIDTLSEKQAVQTLRGVEKVDSKLLKKLDIKTLQEIGNDDKSEQEVAEIILEKTGRKENTANRYKAKQSKLKSLHHSKSR